MSVVSQVENTCRILDTSQKRLAPVAEVGRTVQVYPNPATTQLTIEEAMGLEVSVFDVVGSEVLHGVISSDKEVLDISRFARGIYLLHLSDALTRERVVRRVVVE